MRDCTLAGTATHPSENIELREESIKGILSSVLPAGFLQWDNHAVTAAVVWKQETRHYWRRTATHHQQSISQIWQLVVKTISCLVTFTYYTTEREVNVCCVGLKSKCLLPRLRTIYVYHLYPEMHLAGISTPKKPPLVH